MPQTLVGVFYDTMTLAVVRVIVPHDDMQLSNGTHALQPNEAMTTISLLQYGYDPDAARSAVRLATGREPPL